MAAIQAIPAYQTVSVPGCAYSVEYAPAVLEEIRRAAVEGLLRVRHGGVEIGGVLFGRLTEDRLAILAWRPIPCEHLHGPSFTLSDADRQKLQELLGSAARDAGLAGMQPLGWFHTHTRSEVLFTEADRDVHQQYFDQPWQTALVLKPDELGAVEGTFFFRDITGPGISIPVPKREQRGPAAEPEPIPRTGATPGTAASASRLQAARSAAAFRAYRQPSGMRRWFLLAGVLLAVATSAWVLRPSRGANVGLRISDERGLLRVDWDRNSSVVRQAKTGKLSVRDGESQVHIELDAAILHNGNVTYQRKSETVELRLAIPAPGGGEIVTVSRFIGQPPPVLPQARPQQPEAGANVEPPERREQAPTANSTPSRATAAKLQPSPESRAGRQVKPRPFTGRQTARRGAPAIPEPQPIASTPQYSPVRSSAPVVPPPEPARAEARPAATRRYEGPRTGRIIWTGRLQEGELLEIERGRVSQGALTGQLPPVPVQIRAHAAELKKEGMVVYGPERPPETPGPQNGWNHTEYRWNRKRSRDLSVVEPPTPGNNWGKIVLRGDQRDLALIVIDWEVIGK